MIGEVKVVSVENPIDYLWKELRYYLDVKWVTKQIVELHAVSQQEKRNARKQADQLSYCIRQAEEYFRAASQVGLATRPLLLYYGAVSLTKALSLLRLDGTFSFDALHQANKHQHHGLDLLRTIRQVKALESVEAFFKAMQSKVYTHPESPGASASPWGHFALFYQSLVSSPVFLEFDEERYGPQGVVGDGLYKVQVPHASHTKRPINAIVPNTFDVLGMMQALPDLYSSLSHYGITPSLTPGRLSLFVQREIRSSSDAMQDANRDVKPGLNRRWRFYLDDYASENGRRLAELFTLKNSALVLERDAGSDAVYRLETDRVDTTPDKSNWLPQVTTTVSGETYYIVDPDSHIEEPAAMFIILFCLGMVARYHSDIWMRAIDDHVQIAELTDTFLNVVNRKFPNMILDQLTFTLHRVRVT